MLSATLLPELALLNVSPDDQRAAPGQVQVLDGQRAEAAMRVECLGERVDDDQQRDHRDEQVHGDHQGQVLALDLLEPPVRLQQERYLRALLKPVLVAPQLLPVVPYPRRPRRPRAAATVSRFAHRTSRPGSG
jgi:hypothetical protein